jgi:hypothetical protein
MAGDDANEASALLLGHSLIGGINPGGCPAMLALHWLR